VFTVLPDLVAEALSPGAAMSGTWISRAGKEGLTVFFLLLLNLAEEEYTSKG
jgi:hypothetical protein